MHFRSTIPEKHDRVVLFVVLSDVSSDVFAVAVRVILTPQVPRHGHGDSILSANGMSRLSFLPLDYENNISTFINRSFLLRPRATTTWNVEAHRNSDSFERGGSKIKSDWGTENRFGDGNGDFKEPDSSGSDCRMRRRRPT